MNVLWFLLVGDLVVATFGAVILLVVPLRSQCWNWTSPGQDSDLLYGLIPSQLSPLE